MINRKSSSLILMVIAGAAGLVGLLMLSEGMWLGAAMIVLAIITAAAVFFLNNGWTGK